jgi:hypothetical protein
MRQEHRLNSILKGRQIEERLILSRLSEVIDVVDRRKQIYNSAVDLLRNLNDKIDSYSGSKRRRAFAAGRIGKVASIDNYVDKRRDDVGRLERNVQIQATELKSAEDRAELIEQELMEVRLEMKKIERYIENLAHRRRVAGVAQEEILMDEMFAALTRRGS